MSAPDPSRKPLPDASARGRLRRWRVVLGIIGAIPGMLLAHLLLALAALCLVYDPGRGWETLRLLATIRTAAPLAGIERETLPYVIGGRSHLGDFYTARPGYLGHPPRGKLLLAPGATPQGRHDPRIQAFAQLLASAGFRVLVPDFPSLARLHLGQADIQVVVDGLRLLTGPPPDQPGQRKNTEPRQAVGLVAISYMVGPAFLALTREALHRQVTFMISIGGYYDLRALATYITTGWYRDPENGQWVYSEPDPFGKWAFAFANAGRLSQEPGAAPGETAPGETAPGETAPGETAPGETAPGGRSRLRQIALQMLRGQGPPTPARVAALTPDEQAVYALITNQDPERVPALLAALPEVIKTEINALNLVDAKLDRIETKVLLLHGRTDPVIPAWQSRALAQALPPDRTRLVELDGLMHADQTGLSFGDLLSLFDLVYGLLAERDRFSAVQ